jgi:hypothetical protein
MCLGESYAASMLRICKRAAAQPLTKAVYGEIARDEATHARFGWIVLDWMATTLNRRERSWLSQAATETAHLLRGSWNRLAALPPAHFSAVGIMGQIDRDKLISYAHRALDDQIARLSSYRIDVSNVNE